MEYRYRSLPHPSARHRPGAEPSGGEIFVAGEHHCNAVISVGNSCSCLAEGDCK